MAPRTMPGLFRLVEGEHEGSGRGAGERLRGDRVGSHEGDGGNMAAREGRRRFAGAAVRNVTAGIRREGSVPERSGIWKRANHKKRQSMKLKIGCK